MSKPASEILNAIEADATTTTLSVYSYETDTPSVCHAVLAVPAVLDAALHAIADADGVFVPDVVN